MNGIDLFCGAGGMSLGAQSCGIRVTHAVEMSTVAAQTFAWNHRETRLLHADIRTVRSNQFSDLCRSDSLVVFGGPPCQGFSTSNQQNRSATNESNWLFQEYLRLVGELRPEWIVFENVKGLIETERGLFLDMVLAGFRKLGYLTSHFVLNSADFGVPQRRNRLFIVGSLGGVSVAPPKPKLTPHVSVREAIADLAVLGNGDAPDYAHYSTGAVGVYSRSMRKRLKGCWNNIVTANSPSVVERYRHIPQGGNWADIPEHLMANYADASRCHTGIYRRLRENEPSVVIGNFRKNMLIHPWEHRGLSVREAARLQSFPDSFRLAGSIGFQQQQIGNAVPPLLARAVFAAIKSA